MHAILLVALLGAACGRVGFGPTSDASGGADTASSDGLADAGAAGPWTSRVLTELDGPDFEEDPSISADRRTIFWAVDAGTAHDIYMATRGDVDQPFGNVVALGLNTMEHESAPEISSDGTALHFIDSSSDIARSASPFTTYVVDAALSTVAPELELAISPDGRTVLINRQNTFFLGERASTAVPFGSLVAVPELAVSSDIASPTITNGAAIVYFHAGTVRDLYRARRTTAGSFEVPVPVVELNTSGRDADPFVLEGDRYMLYTCDAALCEATRN